MYEGSIVKSKMGKRRAKSFLFRVYEIVRDFPNWCPTPDHFFQLSEDKQMYLYWFNVISQEMEVMDRMEEASVNVSSPASTPRVPRRHG